MNPTTTLLTTLAIALAAAPALAEPATRAPRQANALVAMLETREQSIKQVIGDAETVTDADRRERLKGIINGIFDFRRMAELSMGDNWAGLSPAQRGEFTDLFAQLVRNHSIRNLDVYKARIRYGDATINGETASVHTTATYDDKRARIEYRFVWDGERGEWVVTDFLLDGVSTARSYEKSFAKIMRQHGYDGLIDRIQQKLDDT